MLNYFHLEFWRYCMAAPRTRAAAKRRGTAGDVPLLELVATLALLATCVRGDRDGEGGGGGGGDGGGGGGGGGDASSPVEVLPPPVNPKTDTQTIFQPALSASWAQPRTYTTPEQASPHHSTAVQVEPMYPVLKRLELSA